MRLNYWKWDRIPRWFYILSVILWLGISGIAIKAFMTPTEIKEDFVSNKIQQRTIMEYKLDVVPNALYPAGGIVIPDNVIYPNVLKSLLIHIDSKVSAESTVKVDGLEKISLKLVSDNAWVRDLLVKPENKVSTLGTENSLGGGDLVINLKDITNFIKKFELETKASGRYFLLVNREFKGDVTSNNRTVPIDLKSELKFEFAGNTLKLVEEEGKAQSTTNEISYPGSKTIANEIIIQDTNIKEQKFVLIGKEIKIATARTTFLVIAFVYFLLFVVPLGIKGRSKKMLLSEVEKIDKIHRKRLLTVHERVRGTNEIMVDSFNSLLILADEKEELILRFEHGYRVTYTIIIQGYIYYYEIENRHNNNKVEPSIIENEIIPC